ncbi:hypothetical protein L226DRAFT_610200 [Lentinus tigrinus ALCF2SS1-7]|uniref:Uncharacterized protein n=1 Tax=Lentinus tigrinus ALCF2SS1-6 TaxID=1328759 RepID=A0A5C2SJ83_9APHY|nr:hypothetical protein L227DRAFT_598933 [Lentinus tigrinus ALCF2SS1-6]RPD78241.1 hypothetical protein L226DRAFT_610200 [Lentinus tigrinus ALCF2SS1-7]
MSLARAAGAIVRPSKRAGTTLLQRRAASSHAHDEHHHEEYHDTNVYEPEVFNTSFWRRAVIAAVGVVAFYKYAPAPGDDNPIAKYISSTMTPAEVWHNMAFKHLAMSAQGSDDTKLMVDAKPPTVHRYRYPQRFEQYSPNSQPVGIKLSVDDIVVKRD